MSDMEAREDLARMREHVINEVSVADWGSGLIVLH